MNRVSKSKIDALIKIQRTKSEEINNLMQLYLDSNDPELVFGIGASEWNSLCQSESSFGVKFGDDVRKVNCSCHYIRGLPEGSTEMIKSLNKLRHLIDAWLDDALLDRPRSSWFKLFFS